jgi:diaminopimelate decarboxylase
MSVAVEEGTRPTIGGLDPERLAEEFGTPLYVYDLDVVDRQVAELRSALPTVFDVAFAVKANPSLGVVAHLGALGLGADVASGGELATVIRAGIAPSGIVFTGPGKRDEELEAAVVAGIRAVTVESLGELDRLEQIAAGLGIRTSVLLRLATAAALPDTDIPIGGENGGKFGLDSDDLPEAARRAVRSPHLRLLGLHAFGASNVLDADAIADHVGRTVSEAGRMAARIRAELDPDFQLELVDAGGGLGIPYADGDPELDLDRLGRRLANMTAAWAVNDLTRTTHVLLEPGRFLVGPAGTYITRVVDRKTVGGRHIVIVDGGIHHLVRPALVGRPHRIVSLSGAADEAESIMVAGPLCSGLDVLAENAPVNPAVGDLLAVRDTGAYGYTESMPLFLSHPLPAEVAISGGRISLLRPRIEPAMWLETQRLPAWSSRLAGASNPSVPTLGPGSSVAVSVGQRPSGG